MAFLLELASHYQRQYLIASLCLSTVLVLVRPKRLLNLVNEIGLPNARLGKGILPTWTTKIKSFKIPPALFWLISIPINHCLLSREFTVTGIRAGPNVGADHLPLITDLAIATNHQSPSLYEQKS
ncbi:MAG: hypothetical protein K6T90_19735 [Leptolyngbyaceae cyanobacterium HOT.MB2.61]|jgi:hypothetical protein|nr:hypothetical protein [Leptolyngbyaceae cyanobacterium HOT.MB2.61]